MGDVYYKYKHDNVIQSQDSIALFFDGISSNSNE